MARAGQPQSVDRPAILRPGSVRECPRFRPDRPEARLARHVPTAPAPGAAGVVGGRPRAEPPDRRAIFRHRPGSAITVRSRRSSTHCVPPALQADQWFSHAARFPFCLSEDLKQEHNTMQTNDETQIRDTIERYVEAMRAAT